MTWSIKIKAGALQFVLFIGAIITVLLLVFVLLSHTHALFDKKTDIKVDLIQAVDRAMFRSFGQNEERGQPWELSKTNELGIQTSVQKAYWGVLEKRSVTARKGKIKVTKTSFVGHGHEDRYALYLKDNQRPMVIAGNAMIIGDAFLPQQGIKMGNIQGFGYTKAQLIYGRTLKSSTTLPKLNEEMQWQLDRLTNSGEMPKGDGLDLKKKMVVANSFLEIPKVVQGDFINLEAVSLSGNIVIWATDAIKIHRSAQLRDVVLVAPKIEVTDGVVGSFQAIASKWITVGKNCTLEYPTVLAVQRSRTYDEQTSMEQDPRILVEDGSWVSGTLIYMDQNVYKGNGPYIKIDEGATIKGEVHCTQNLELKGNVLGSVVTNAFVAKVNGNVYLNHLFHGRVDASLLPMEYGGICYEINKAKRVMKWLY
ncbi:MAG: bactofilin family protein [Flagellimonas sp.]